MTTVRACDLEEGMVIDALPYFAEYLLRSDPDYTAAEYELATIDYVERESSNVVLVGMFSDVYGVPAHYECELTTSENDR